MVNRSVVLTKRTGMDRGVDDAPIFFRYRLSKVKCSISPARSRLNNWRFGSRSSGCVSSTQFFGGVLLSNSP